MFKPSRKFIQPGNRLKTNIMLIIHFFYFPCQEIICLRQMRQFRESWDHYQRICIHVSRPWFVYQFVSHYTLTIFECRSNFSPILCKLIKQATLIGPQMIKGFINCKSSVICPPSQFTIAGRTRGKSSYRIKLSLFGDWPGKRRINRFGDCPQWNSICAKFLTKKVLMKLYKCIDIVFSCHLHDLFHLFQIFVIKLTLFWFDSRPHNSQTQPIYPPLLKMLHISFIKFEVNVGKYLLNNIQSMKDSLPIICVPYSIITNCQVTYH